MFTRSDLLRIHGASHLYKPELWRYPDDGCSSFICLVGACAEILGGHHRIPRDRQDGAHVSSSGSLNPPRIVNPIDGEEGELLVRSVPLS
jgi:hypothetical protein